MLLVGRPRRRPACGGRPPADRACQRKQLMKIMSAFIVLFSGRGNSRTDGAHLIQSLVVHRRQRYHLCFAVPVRNAAACDGGKDSRRLTWHRGSRHSLHASADHRDAAVCPAMRGPASAGYRTVHHTWGWAAETRSPQHLPSHSVSRRMPPPRG